VSLFHALARLLLIWTGNAAVAVGAVGKFRRRLSTVYVKIRVDVRLTGNSSMGDEGVSVESQLPMVYPPTTRIFWPWVTTQRLLLVSCCIVVPTHLQKRPKIQFAASTMARVITHRDFYFRVQRMLHAHVAFRCDGLSTACARVMAVWRSTKLQRCVSVRVHV
jgi:hypothetical protein